MILFKINRNLITFLKNAELLSARYNRIFSTSANTVDSDDGQTETHDTAAQSPTQNSRLWNKKVPIKVVDFGMKRQNSFDVTNLAGSGRINGNPTGLKLVPDCNP
ncbi:hypothetical protein AVEN_154899-1 [Araneus ventricosus]|uniref:Uncharacterized protein n=1 Tax=Araneus ventricosus TaxID=182803 RepID=A0A4Y2A739_ARAVE|nr:hypothetical protein AVEN_154899-1 [Araneus ventricosus]